MNIFENIDFWADPITEEKQEPTKRRKTECLERITQNEYRRAYSETQLLDVTPKILKKGYSYNFITGGDVDAMSYLKIILRQQNLNYCLLSTWVMACDDVLQLKEWLEKGMIKKLDCYLGEVFPNQYKQEMNSLKNIIPKYGGRIAVFKNHSKIFAGIGEKFAFGIQTSANINTNPRTENACITITNDIFEFYKDYFDGIKSYTH